MSGKPVASIVNAGMSKFGRRDGLYMRDLLPEAFEELIDRCPNLDPKRDIDFIFVGTANREALKIRLIWVL